MLRKIFCYFIFFSELLIILYLILFVNKYLPLNYNIFKIIIVLSILNIPALLFAIILFGAPNNHFNEYNIKHISYKDIIENSTKIVVTYKNGIWEYFYKNKYYKFDLKYWINIKKRVSDLIFIQYHNNYCNLKKIKNKQYYKNFFKKYNIKIEFVKNDKKVICDFKPSFILKIKMLISCSQFRHQKYHLNDFWERDLWDTFMILKFKNKN